jgi:hypothetical protein
MNASPMLAEEFVGRYSSRIKHLRRRVRETQREGQREMHEVSDSVLKQTVAATWRQPFNHDVWSPRDLNRLS